MTPLAELVSIGHEYTCDRKLFSFVNRNLNAIGLRANVIDIRFRSRTDLVVFIVEKLMQEVA
jgi:hypothetical protein